MESLLLSCRALSSPTTCRFIPAHSVPFFPFGEPRHVQVQLLRFGYEVVAGQLILTGEEEVVHLPELALVCGGEGGFVGEGAFFVHGERVVFEGESQLTRIGEQELADDRGGHGAVGTLEVTELD